MSIAINTTYLQHFVENTLASTYHADIAELANVVRSTAWGGAEALTGGTDIEPPFRPARPPAMKPESRGENRRTV